MGKQWEKQFIEIIIQCKSSTSNRKEHNMTVRDLYIYSRDEHTFILFKEGETKACFKGSLEDCPTELIDKLVYQFRAIDFNTIEVILIR